MASIVLADIVIGYNRTKILEGVIQEVLDDPELDSRIISARQDALNDLLPWKYSLFILWCFIISGVMYLLANSTLRPINEMIQLQKRFISNASHELRTPLTVMKMQSEVALRMKNQLSKEEIENILVGNISEINHISEIINTLLHISNSVNSSKNIVMKKLSLSESIIRVLKSTALFASSKDISISFESSNNFTINGNAAALDGVLTNVIQNAIFYTNQGGFVAIETCASGNECQIKVTDTGIGIPEHDLPYIFTPFFRGNDSRAHRPQGSGLGLTLVKELVLMQKGRIVVESEVGKGTSVDIFFPRVL
jgi:signal transduction histidine kinase